MKIKLNKILVLVLVLALMSTTAFAIPNNSNGIGRENAPGQMKKGDFTDTEGFWAERYIERMAKKDVIKGVGNGAFMPSNTAKEIETIVMLLRELEVDVDESAVLPEDYNGKKPSDWMVPYITAANEEGLITDEEMDTFDPNFPTKRSKAAVYFVRAAGMEDEALANMDLVLEFRDFNAIPEEHIGYVYVAYQIGLIQGYPDKNFQPNKAINRAELAAMMTRFDDEFDTEFSYSLFGKIEEVDIEDMQLTLLIRGNEKTYDISDDVDVYIDNEPADLDDLAVNMVVKVYIEDNEIIEISFRSDDDDDKVTKRFEGEIQDLSEDFDEITIEEDDEDLTFAITDETKIHVPVLDNELIEEFVGLNAKVIAENTTASSIWIELNKVEGTLVDLNYDDDDLVSVDVELDDSTIETYVFFEETKIYVDDVLEDLTEDAIGHEVEMMLLGTDEVVRLKVDTEVDTEDLEELVEDAEELVEDNYTEETWEDFEDAFDSAELVLAETYPTQAEVNEAYDNLEDAIDDLIATVTDLVVTDEDVVTDLDNTTLEITVVEGSTVEGLEDAVKSEFNATFTVLDESEGVSVADDVEVTEDMVLEVTAEDTTIVVEFTIIIQ
ncbi:MAG: S-layer homology domain-containing protein [Bacillota bacterium]|nr:S-layer homology domain-containing protein [Bacillota bacterium]